ncbi:MAG TPA: hypothetical protein DER01_02925, partial [Phycisphaerales bacterium]|nr:hypothetical protein [Phycisphaerales bacterium]
MVFQSNVRSTQYKKGGRLIGNTGVGNCVIETTNVDGVYLKNIAILRGTTTDASDIGILQARGTQGTSYWAGDQYHENVFIDMGSNKDSNNSFGTIGFVNLAAEETRWHNIQIWANLPLIITWTDSCTRTKGDFSGLDTLTFSSDVGIQLAQNASNTVFRISGLGRLISYDYFSPCVLINSAATVDLGHCFMQKRISTTGAQTGDYVYAVENWNVSQFMHFGGVEGCEGYLLNRRDFTEADLNIRLAPVETSLPVIYLFDDGGNYQLRNVQMRVSSLYQDRPLIACKRFDGNNNEAMPFTLKNCEFKTDLPLNMTTLSDKRILRQTTYSTFHFKNQSLKVSDHCLTTDIRMNVGQNGQSVEIARIHMPTYITNLGAFTASIQLSGT